jgi:hypothetical protein
MVRSLPWSCKEWPDAPVFVLRRACSILGSWALVTKKTWKLASRSAQLQSPAVEVEDTVVPDVVATEPAGELEVVVLDVVASAPALEREEV